MKGTRADLRMLELGLAESREKARAQIMAGLVYEGERRVDKPGQAVAENAELFLRGAAMPFVSRGGLKLQKALDKHGLSLEGALALDIGASTGGFTDCMLQYGARRVYAIDVGYGQLDYKLRNDARVVVMERTNARFLEPAWLGGAEADFASVDVSFISIALILPPLCAVLRALGRAVVLVKPQFEAGRGKVGKNGVVRDAAIHAEVLESAMAHARASGFRVLDIDYSPIKGPKGNIEFLMLLEKGEAENPPGLRVQETVDAAHRELGCT